MSGRPVSGRYGAGSRPPGRRSPARPPREGSSSGRTDAGGPERRPPSRHFAPHVSNAFWRIALPHTAVAVPVARALVRTALTDLEHGADRDTVEPLTAELVANAVEHAVGEGPIELVMEVVPGGAPWRCMIRIRRRRGIWPCRWVGSRIPGRSTAGAWPSFGRWARPAAIGPPGARRCGSACPRSRHSVAPHRFLVLHRISGTACPDPMAMPGPGGTIGRAASTPSATPGPPHSPGIGVTRTPTAVSARYRPDATCLTPASPPGPP